MSQIAKVSRSRGRLLRRALILTFPAIVAIPGSQALANDANPIRSFAETSTTSKSKSQQIKKSSLARLKAARLKRKNMLSAQSISKIQREISSGFDPNLDGFSFPNWFGPASPEEDSLPQLVSLFGSSSICDKQSTPTTCEPFSSAAEFAASMDQLIAEGRCEGMVVLASKLFREYKLGNSSNRTIEKNKPATLNEISYWWATQVLPTVSTESARTKSKQPSELIDLIAAGVADGATSSLGIYFEGKGHTLLPIAFHQNSSIVTIDVYDSNTPRLTQYLTIDLTAESWSYKSTDEAGNILMRWTGAGVGSLDVVSIYSRRPQATSFFGKN